METFGYHFDDALPAEPAGLQVSEAKDAETLHPLVILYVRFRFGDQYPHAVIELERDSEIEAVDGLAVTKQLALKLTIDRAEWLAAELNAMAARAREKHWE